MTPIIHRPDLLNRRRRAALGLIGLLGWAVWIYLWLPFATFGGWIFSGWLFRRQMVEPGENYFLTILGYLAVIIALAVVFLGWALYNGARFRGLDRRKARPVVEDWEIAAFFRIPEPDLKKLREARRAVLHLSAEGEITEVETALPPPGKDAPPLGVPSPAFGRGAAGGESARPPGALP